MYHILIFHSKLIFVNLDMKIKDTLKAWSDAEINLVTKDSSAFDYNDRWIKVVFFGSCDGTQLWSK